MAKFALILSIGTSLLALSAPSGVHGQGADGPLIQLSVARETPAPGFRFARLLANGGFYVAERPIVSDDQIEAVRASVKPGGLLLDVRLKPTAASELQRLVRSNIGARIAVMIGAELVAAPAIVDPNAISKKRLQISVELPQGRAHAIAQDIAQRWPASDTIKHN